VQLRPQIARALTIRPTFESGTHRRFPQIGDEALVCVDSLWVRYPARTVPLCGAQFRKERAALSVESLHSCEDSQSVMTREVGDSSSIGAQRTRAWNLVGPSSVGPLCHQWDCILTSFFAAFYGFVARTVDAGGQWGYGSE